MKISKKYIAYAILTIFLLYGILPEFFERNFYLNEILAFTGFLLFLKHSFKGSKFVLPASSIYRLVLLLLSLGIINMFFSFFIKTNLYFYLRNAVIVYSIFAFFLGYFLFSYQRLYFNSIRNLLRVYLLPTVLLGIKPILDRWGGAVFFPFLFRSFNRTSIAALLILNFIYSFTFESLTVTLVTLILLSVIIVKRYVYFRILFTAVLLFFVLMTSSLTPNIELYRSGPYNLFGNVEAVTQSHFLLGLDDNTTWRLVYWYRILVERFPRNIIGIGMGTPLLHYVPGMDTYLTSVYDDEYDIHVMGVHNSYLTLFARLGVLYFVFLYLIYGIILKEYYGWLAYYRSRNLAFLFVSFFTVSIIGLFNLVLESPIVASLYWAMLGFLARAIHQRHVEAFAWQQQSTGTRAGAEESVGVAAGKPR